MALTCRPLEHQAQQLCDIQWQVDLAAQSGDVKLEPSEEVKRQGRLRRPSHRLKDDQSLNRAGRGKSSKGRVPVIKQEVNGGVWPLHMAVCVWWQPAGAVLQLVLTSQGGLPWGLALYCTCMPC